MPEPIVVVDYGTAGTSAALVLGERAHLLGEPAGRRDDAPTTGAHRWPSSVCWDGTTLHTGSAAVRRRAEWPRRYFDEPRRALDVDATIRLGDRELTGGEVLSSFLAAVRVAAEGVYGAQITRVVLSLPAGYGIEDQRRTAVIEAGDRAGLPDVELVPDAVAAVLDPDAADLFAPGSLAVVADLGATWTASVVRVAGDDSAVLATETSPAGSDLDTALVNGVRAQHREWLEPLFAAGEAGLGAYYQTVELVRRLKHELADATEAARPLRSSLPPVRLTRDRLEQAAEPQLRWLVMICEQLLGRVQATPDAIGAVLVTGGGARLPMIETALRNGLNAGLGGRRLTVRRAQQPELGVLRGLVRWATGAPARTVGADRPQWRMQPVLWQIPGGSARILRWHVAAGQPYPAGSALAQIRTVDDRVYDLTATRDGVLIDARAEVGETVGPLLVSAATKPLATMAGAPPAKLHHFSVTGEWLLTPDRRVLVECADTGRYVRLRSIQDGQVLREFQPSYGEEVPRHGRVFITPAGRLALVAWDPGGTFFVWDVDSGALQASFRESGGPFRVMVNEGEWRLTAEGENGVQVGRYRRQVINVWDLNTGKRLEKVTDESWQRRHSGYAVRSAADGLRESADSPDGQLRAVAVRATTGTAVALRDAVTDSEVFRAVSAPSRRARAAFSADGRYLLAAWESDDRSHLDVWEI